MKNNNQKDDNPVWCTSYYKGTDEEIRQQKQKSHKKLIKNLHKKGFPELLNTSSWY